MRHGWGIALVLCSCFEHGGGDVAPRRDAGPAQPQLSDYLDPAFGNAGAVELASITEGAEVVVDVDGSIVIFGRSEPGCALTRLHPDGTVDTSFGQNGVAVLAFGSDGCGPGGLALQGTSILVGARAFTTPTLIVLCRFTSSGAIDTSFGNSAAGVAGCAATEDALSARGVAVMGDGSIRYGSDKSLYRYSANGALADKRSIFPTQPWYLYARADDLFVGIKDGFRASIAAFTADGSDLDSYALNGRSAAGIPVDFVEWDMDLRPDGRPLLAARSHETTISVAQLTTDGERDTSFGTNGVTTFELSSSLPEVTAIAARASGEVMLFATSSGFRDTIVYALDAAGNRMPRFGVDGALVTPHLGKIYDAVAQPDGKLVAVGSRSDKLLVLRFR